MRKIQGFDRGEILQFLVLVDFGDHRQLFLLDTEEFLVLAHFLLHVHALIPFLLGEHACLLIFHYHVPLPAKVERKRPIDFLDFFHPFRFDYSQLFAELLHGDSFVLLVDQLLHSFLLLIIILFEESHIFIVFSLLRQLQSLR